MPKNSARRLTTRQKITKYWWVILLIATPIVITALLTLHYSVHVPFWDQWEFIKILEKYKAHTLGWSDFWAQHNEHRIVVPRLVMFALAMVTHWDPYYEVIVNIVLAIGIVWLALMLLRRTITGKPLLILASIMTAWLLMSPIQYENWLWGWQIQWYLSVVGVMFTLWCLSTPKLTNKLLVGGIAGGIVATYSLANGFTLWAIAFLLLLFTDSTWRQRIIFGVTGLLTTALHYYHYVNPAYEPPKTFFLHHPRAYLHYVLVYLGRPLTFDFHQSPFAGLALLAIFVVSVGYLWFMQRKVFKKGVVWFCLALYGLGGAFLTGISRLGLGVEQSFSSRYTTISTLFILGTFILGLMALQAAAKTYKWTPLQQRISLYVLTIPIALLVLINYAGGIYYMRGQHAHLVSVKNCLQTSQSEDDPCLTWAYPDGKIAWQRLQFLREYHYGGLDH